MQYSYKLGVMKLEQNIFKAYNISGQGFEKMLIRIWILSMFNNLGN